MQFKTLTLAVPVMAALAFAQSSSQYPDRSQTGSQSTQSKQSTQQSDTTTTQKSTDKADKSMSSKTWKGTLVDASCAANMSSSRGMSGSSTSSSARTGDTSSQSTADRSANPSSTDTSSSSSTDRSANPDTSTDRSTSSQSSTNKSTDTGAMSERSGSSQSTSHKEMSTSGSANRMQAQSCPVTTSTTSFGLITSDGQFVRFDESGNAKVSQELKTNNKWTKDVNGGKQISAKVRGTMMGDTLQVESVK